MTMPSNLWLDGNYLHLLFQSERDLQGISNKFPNIYFTKIDDRYSIASFEGKEDNKATLDLLSKELLLVRSSLYTLQYFSPIVSANIKPLQLNLPLKLTGKGVTVAIIDTGIDYLNPIFMDEKGGTRIDLLWDQTITPPIANTTPDVQIPISNVPFGTIYTKENINKAIALKTSGGDPYTIVPSKDENSHGTAMASIIGGRFTTDISESVAPECSFVIIKLMEDLYSKKDLDIKVPVYSIISIISSLNFLYKYSLSNNVPLVIYLPLGTNLQNHKGTGVLEEYIDNISINRGLVVVSGTGNEGDKSEHTSGTLAKKGDFKDIQLYISPEQRFLDIQIWVATPNIMSIKVSSPSGESTGFIPAFINTKQDYTFIFEKTFLAITYDLPEEYSGDELITINMRNLQPGTWKLTLSGDYILDGGYNVWIPQSGITIGGTRFIAPDPYGTITSPSSSRYIITVANYNQNNNNIVNSSGMAFLDKVYNEIIVAAGGVEVHAIDNNGNLINVSGTSVSTAVVGGCCALLLEWGIVQGNDPNMYSEKIKNYLITGTTKRPGDVYPNAEWGYGILNLLGVFQNMI